MSGSKVWDNRFWKIKHTDKFNKTCDEICDDFDEMHGENGCMENITHDEIIEIAKKCDNCEGYYFILYNNFNEIKFRCWGYNKNFDRCSFTKTRIDYNNYREYFNRTYIFECEECTYVRFDKIIRSDYYWLNIGTDPAPHCQIKVTKDDILALVDFLEDNMKYYY